MCAFALACAVPDLVRTFTILDVTVPGIGPDISQGGRRWHHAFHMTPELPEALVVGREREYLGWFYREFCWQRGAIEQHPLTVGRPDRIVDPHVGVGELEYFAGLARERIHR